MAKVIYAWCGCVLSDDFPGDFDSHGICPECLAKELEKLEEATCASQR